jgi:hypothetical protein
MICLNSARVGMNMQIRFSQSYLGCSFGSLITPNQCWVVTWCNGKKVPASAHNAFSRQSASETRVSYSLAHTVSAYSVSVAWLGVDLH